FAGRCRPQCGAAWSCGWGASPVRWRKPRISGCWRRPGSRRSVWSRRGSTRSRRAGSWGRSCGPGSRSSERVSPSLPLHREFRPQSDGGGLAQLERPGTIPRGERRLTPADRVNLHTIETLRDYDIPWAGHAPRSIDGLEREPWDFVITVCDRAKEACPIFPGQPILAHWGMPDPAEVVGDEAAKRQAFEAAFLSLSRRIDLLLAQPVEELERLALEARLRAIGNTTGEGTG